MSGIKIAKAIQAINPSAIYNIRGDDLDTCEIEWLESTSPISKVDIQAKLDAIAYIDIRKAQYPPLEEFLEAYTEKEIGGDSTKWDAYVVKYNKVRSDNPKP